MEPDIKKPDEEKEITELKENISPEFIIKHPLQNTWTLWFFDHGFSKNWEDNQRAIITFNTIEDFWSVFNHIKTASELRQGCDYSLFKENVRPMWEDAVNRNGGRWLLSLEKKQRVEELDKYWLELMLLLIGEGFEENSDEICGAVINIRGKGDKIAIWTGDAYRSNAIIAIGHKIKDQLKIPANVQIEYQAHKDTASKSGSIVKILHTL